MTDRELLELAAKAMGYRLTWGEKYIVGGDEVDCTDLPYVVSDDREESPAYWNPLEDDGDALRLAVKLKIALSFPLDNDMYVDANDWCTQYLIDVGNDRAAATRRAIVRAAAETGKTVAP